jgi:hypothetical protein
MKVRRLLLTLVLGSLPLGLIASPAGAAKPTRGCPPSFIGPLTFEAIIAMFPPPPDFPDPEGALARFDLNADRQLCVLPLPGGVDINVIDNVANPRASQS